MWAFLGRLVCVGGLHLQSVGSGREESQLGFFWPAFGLGGVWPGPVEQARRTPKGGFWHPFRVRDWVAGDPGSPERPPGYFLGPLRGRDSRRHLVGFGIWVDLASGLGRWRFRALSRRTLRHPERCWSSRFGLTWTGTVSDRKAPSPPALSHGGERGPEIRLLSSCGLGVRGRFGVCALCLPVRMGVGLDALVFGALVNRGCRRGAIGPAIGRRLRLADRSVGGPG